MYNDDQPTGGSKAADIETPEEENLVEEPDLVECIDEDGNSILMEVVRYFFYNGEEYVVLGTPLDSDCDDDCECDCETCCHTHGEDAADEDDDEDEGNDFYIMKVVASADGDEEMEEFVPVEDEALFERLIETVQTQFGSELDNED